MILLRSLLVAAAALTAACSTSIDLVENRGASATVPPVESPTASPEGAPATTPEPAPQQPSATATTVPPTPTPLPPGELSVNDSSAEGQLGDDLLSIVEAVQLANSRLTLADLSPAEAAQVEGAPGATNADTITIALDPGTPILLPGGDRWIIELFSNNGDTLLGGGVVLTGGVQQSGVSHNGMLVGSSDLRISGFVFREVTNAMAVESAGSALSNVSIDANAFVDVAIVDLQIRNSLSDGSITGVAIKDNTFDAPQRRSDLRGFIRIRGGVGIADEPTLDTRIDGLTITGNTMRAPGATVGTCISIAAAAVPFDQPSRVGNSVVADVAIDGNALDGCEIGVELAGGIVTQTNGTITNSRLERVAIRDTTISGTATGISILGARVEPAPASFQYSGATAATLSANRVDGVTIDATAIVNTQIGVSMVGGAFDVDGTGIAEGNVTAGLTAASTTFDAVASACVEAADRGALASGNQLESPCASIVGG